MAEYSRLAKGHFTTSGTPANAQIVTLPFIPDYVELINFTAAGRVISGSAAENSVVQAWWDVKMGQGFAVEQVYAGNTPSVLRYDTVVSGGISTFYAGLALQYGATQAVSTITKADPAVVTSSSAHGLKSGDVVIFQNLYQTSTTGMQQIAGIPFTVTVTGSTTFTIPWDTSTSQYTAYTLATPAFAAATFKKVLYPNLYAPGVNVIRGITTGTTTTIDTTSAHNFVVGQEVAFRIPPSWGTTQLNSLPNTVIPGSPIYGYVVAVTDYNTVVVNINSTGYTAYTANIPFLSFPGLTFPQIVAVGDVNTGGVQISANSALYPPPFTRPIGNTTVDTINGPAIQGSFFNNTSMGFIVGSGAGAIVTGSSLVGVAGDVIYWKAYLHDYST